MKIHIVKKGDTLYQLAQKYGIELEDLIKANPIIHDPDDLIVGLKVKIPAKPSQIKVGKIEIQPAKHHSGQQHTSQQHTSQQHTSQHQNEVDLFSQKTVPSKKVSSFYDLPELNEMKQHESHTPKQKGQTVSDKHGMPLAIKQDGPIYPAEVFVPCAPQPELYHTLANPNYALETMPYISSYTNYSGVPQGGFEWQYTTQEMSGKIEEEQDRVDISGFDLDGNRKETKPVKRTKKATVQHHSPKKTARARKRPIKRSQSTPWMKQ